MQGVHSSQGISVQPAEGRPARNPERDRPIPAANPAAPRGPDRAGCTLRGRRSPACFRRTASGFPLGWLTTRTHSTRGVPSDFAGLLPKQLKINQIYFHFRGTEFRGGGENAASEPFWPGVGAENRAGAARQRRILASLSGSARAVDQRGRAIGAPARWGGSSTGCPNCLSGLRTAMKFRLRYNWR